MSLCAALAPRTLLARHAVTPLAAGASAQTHTQTRGVSSSPYGRTHVWKHRQKKMPKPFVPQFPQRVIRADGSTFTHYTTSPRSSVRLTRDTTNNPLWNAAKWMAENEEEDVITGRLGRFNRRFDGIGGHGAEIDWIREASGEGLQEVEKEAEKGGKA